MSDLSETPLAKEMFSSDWMYMIKQFADARVAQGWSFEDAMEWGFYVSEGYSAHRSQQRWLMAYAKSREKEKVA